MSNRTTKWHQLTKDETLRQLHTNASCGLSCKEARSRFRKQGPNRLFDASGQNRSLLTKWIKDASLWLFAMVCLFAVCFGELSAGISGLMGLCLWLGWMMNLLLQLHHYQELLKRLQIPKIHVLREGKHLSVSARQLVSGDLVFLRKGDIVPADCRLLESNQLSVKLIFGKKHAQTRTVFVQDKDAEITYPYGSNVQAPNCQNLLYGGSEVLQGEAFAVILETGEHCFLGAMHESVYLEKRETNHDPLYTILPYFKLYAWLVLLLMLPLSIVGLLISPQENSAFRVFLPICAMVASASVLIPQVFLEVLLHRPTLQSLANAKQTVAILQKTPAARNQLPYITDLILLGDAALSDGRFHAISAFIGQTDVELKLPQPILGELCDAFLLLQKADEKKLSKQSLQTPIYADLLSELCKTAAFDQAAFRLRKPEIIEDLSHSAYHRQIAVTDHTGSYQLHFATGIALISGCVSYIDHNRTIRSMDFDVREAARTFAGKVHAAHHQVITVVKEINGQRIFCGCLQIGKQYLMHLPEWIERYRSLGVQVKWFLSQGNTEWNTIQQEFAPAECYYKTAEGELLRAGEAYRCLIGFSQNEIAAYIKQLRTQNRTVAVLSNDVGDKKILAQANIKLACDCLNRTDFLVDSQQSMEEMPQHCAPILRQEADLLLPLTTKTGGGVADLFGLLVATRKNLIRIRFLLQKLAALQIFRCLFFVFFEMFGLGSTPAYLFFFASCFFDIAVFYLSVTAEVKQTSIAKPWMPDDSNMRRIFLRKGLWLTAVVPVTILVVLILIARSVGWITSSEIATVLSVTLLLMQLILLFFGREREHIGRFSIFGMVMTLLLFLLPLLIGVLLSILFPPIATILELGAWNLPSLFLVLLAPVLTLFSILLLSRSDEY